MVVFYPIAKQTKKYYYDDQESNLDRRYHVQRLDEFAVSIDFPHDYDSLNQQYQYEHIQPIKNVRFNDNPTWIPHSRNTTSIPIDPYYFHPETISQIDNPQPSVRYITTPFFWFRPVHDHNYAICIPTSRPSLHAYIVSSLDSQSTPNPVRL